MGWQPKNVTQVEIARYLGATQAAISKWKRQLTVAETQALQPHKVIYRDQLGIRTTANLHATATQGKGFFNFA